MAEVKALKAGKWGDPWSEGQPIHVVRAGDVVSLSPEATDRQVAAGKGEVVSDEEPPNEPKPKPKSKRKQKRKGTGPKDKSEVLG